jgi:Rad3-related DNA helicase
MKFCGECKGLVYDLPDGERCQPCIDRKNKPPKVTRVPPQTPPYQGKYHSKGEEELLTGRKPQEKPRAPPPPKPPIQVPTKKSAPKPIALIPHLERIAEYRTKVGDGQPVHPTESQKEIIKKIEDCIKNKETRIIISAPTGCGKSWLAATLASAYGAVILTSTNDLQDQYCGTEEGFEEDKVPGDFEFMNAVRGKHQYLCELSENTKKCDEAYCTDCDYLVKDGDVTISKDGPLHERKETKAEKTLCRYFEADQVGKESGYSVYSYASYIARMKAEKFKMIPEDKLPEKTVLVCDEAHDYDKVVSDQLLVKIDAKLNQEIIGKTLPSFSGLNTLRERIEKTRDFIEKVLDGIKNSLENGKKCAKHSNILSSKKHLVKHREVKCDIHNFTYDKTCKSCQPMKKFLEGECFQCDDHNHLELLVGNCKLTHGQKILKDVNRYILYGQELEFLLHGLTKYPDNYVITNENLPHEFSVVPYKTKWFTEQILEKFNLCIFMSATINDTILAKETGFSKDTFKFINQPSDIPKENRQIKFLNSYSYKNEDDRNDVMIDKIKEIFDKHSEQRGLILCTSYYQIKNILDGFEEKFPNDYKRLTGDYKSYDKNAPLKTAFKKEKKFKDTIKENIQKEYGVIISAKAGTGLDLKDDWSRFQIIIKAPYLKELQNEDDIRAQKIMDEDPERYFIKSMFRLVQFAGRSVRGIHDKAETYVLDDAARKMVAKNWWDIGEPGYLPKQRENVPNWFFNACDFDAKL